MPLLLRLLLSLALILNGSAPAMAHAQMALQGAGHAAHAGATVQKTACHHHDAASKASTQPAMSASTGHANASDCCLTGQCRGSCVQHCAAVATSLTSIETFVPRSDSWRTLATGHRPPALPHLIRPPIGEASPGAAVRRSACNCFSRLGANGSRWLQRVA